MVKRKSTFQNLSLESIWALQKLLPYKQVYAFEGDKGSSEGCTIWTPAFNCLCTWKKLINYFLTEVAEQLFWTNKQQWQHADFVYWYNCPKKHIHEQREFLGICIHKKKSFCKNVRTLEPNCLSVVMIFSFCWLWMLKVCSASPGSWYKIPCQNWKGKKLAKTNPQTNKTLKPQTKEGRSLIIVAP